MKRGALLLTLLVLIATNALGQETRISFTWAFVKQAPDGSPSPLNFTERVAVSVGDLFKIFLQPSTGTFVYLFLQDAAGDVQMLFPDRFEDFAASSYGKTRYLIPAGNDWFTLDSSSGTERFHLLASATRLGTLETRALALLKVSADTRSSATARSSARQAVMDEITRVRKEHSQLAVAAEKPVTIAGGTRGLAQDLEKRAVTIDGAGFYTKTFRLEH